VAGVRSSAPSQNAKESCSTMILRWFDGRAAESFGAELARSFVARVPVERELSERKFEVKAKAAIAQLQSSAAKFKDINGLNFYQKAKLGNAFQWALKDAGYPPEYVAKLTDLLMLQLD
jgi:hypothetical protein